MPELTLQPNTATDRTILCMQSEAEPHQIETWVRGLSRASGQACNWFYVDQHAKLNRHVVVKTNGDWRLAKRHAIQLMSSFEHGGWFPVQVIWQRHTDD